MPRKTTDDKVFDAVSDICFQLPLWGVPLVATACGALAYFVTQFALEQLMQGRAEIPENGPITMAGIAFTLSLIAGFTGWIRRKRQQARVKARKQL
jgi:hypothetical protein